MLKTLFLTEESGTNSDNSDNDSCGHRLQEHLMKSDVLVKILLLFLSLHWILVDGVDQFCSL